MNKKILLILTLLFGATVAHATTYYIAANGSDANNGTSKSTPWEFAPGMQSCAIVCNSTTPVAGDLFIFRGGDTWHFGNSGLSPFVGSGNTAWNWTWSGTSTNCQLNETAGTIKTSSCIYIGVDVTWFSGGAFARPIWTLDNAANSGQWVTSCAHDDGLKNEVTMHGAYVLWDNFEVAGACSGSTNTTPAWFVQFADMNMFKNFYYHGWTLTGQGAFAISGAVFSGGNVTYTYTLSAGSAPSSGNYIDIYGMADAGNNGKFQISGTGSGTFTVPNSSGVSRSGQSGAGATIIDVFQLVQQQDSGGFFRVDHLMLDGSDSTWGTVPYEATGQGVGPCTETSNSVIRHVANYCVSGGLNMEIAHDTLFEYMYDGVAGSHGNMVETQGASPANQYFYNNMIRHADEGIQYVFQPADGANLYFFNDIIYDTANATNCALIAPPSSGTNIFVLTNNTIDAQANVQNNTNGGCQVAGGGANTSSNVHALFENNHLINYSPQALASLHGTGSALFVDNGQNVLSQNEAAAVAQGYVGCQGTPACSTGNSYQPTTASNTTNITYHNGTNLSSSCATYSFDSALCFGSTGGETTSGSGVDTGLLVPSPTARSTTWDSTAWQYPITGGGGVTTISPTSNNYMSVAVGSSSSNVTFTLTNSSSSTVTGITITNVGGNTGDFVNAGTGTCSSSLSASASCTIIYYFHPASTGSRSTTLNVADSDSSSPQQATLTGTGTSPLVGASSIKSGIRVTAGVSIN